MSSLGEKDGFLKVIWQHTKTLGVFNGYKQSVASIARFYFSGGLRQEGGGAFMYVFLHGIKQQGN